MSISLELSKLRRERGYSNFDIARATGVTEGDILKEAQGLKVETDAADQS